MPPVFVPCVLYCPWNAQAVGGSLQQEGEECAGGCSAAQKLFVPVVVRSRAVLQLDGACLKETELRSLLASSLSLGKQPLSQPAVAPLEDRRHPRHSSHLGVMHADAAVLPIFFGFY